MKAETLLPLGKLDPGLAAPEVNLDVTSLDRQACEVEQLGYHCLVLEETKDDPFTLLGLAAAATERLHLGTSVAIAFARSPYVTAMSAWTLQKISGGRFELGLGSQVRAHIQRRFGQDWHPPGPWMREYVEAVRAIWHSWQSGSDLNFHGQHYHLDLNVPLFTPAAIEHPNIPILIAAVNPYMCSVAGEVADGVRLHPVCSPDYIESVVLPAIASGQARRAASRSTTDPPHSGFEVCLKPLIASAPGKAELPARIEVARQRLAFYLSTPAYRPVFAQAGHEALARQASVLARDRQWQALTALIDDDMLHKWVVVATYDQLASKVAARYGHLLQRIEISVPLVSAGDQEALAAIVSELQS